jgi:hypothetical protein
MREHVGPAWLKGKATRARSGFTSGRPMHRACLRVSVAADEPSAAEASANDAADLCRYRE